MTTLERVFSRISLASEKDTLAFCEDRDAAIVVTQNIKDNIEMENLIDTGRMYESIRPRRSGDEWVVEGIYYTKYNNGRFGIVDDAVADANIDGYGSELAI
jgi:hypothetical protein